MRWFRPAFAIALDRVSKPAGYDGLRRFVHSVGRPVAVPVPALRTRSGRANRSATTPSVGVHWHRLQPYDRVAVEVLGDDRPAVADHGLLPGRGAERVQVNLFHGDQGMFGIALGLACPRRRAWPTSLRTWALM